LGLVQLGVKGRIGPKKISAHKTLNPKLKHYMAKILCQKGIKPILVWNPD
jgi:hypothetical protein